MGSEVIRRLVYIRFSFYFSRSSVRGASSAQVMRLNVEAAEQAVSCLTSLRHVNTMVPCEHRDLSKQHASCKQASGENHLVTECLERRACDAVV